MSNNGQYHQLMSSYNVDQYEEEKNYTNMNYGNEDKENVSYYSNMQHIHEYDEFNISSSKGYKLGFGG
jgi:hypothetical protein